ncbi:hypothetical protein [Salinimicrobium oceani]|uniref:PH domain-containing protein n=1 Tax=Salinimicrobium oceani TaxID=2722702 RepID=A0ABX1CZ32_9FLAO|nr:hypothetical protein [Salinimicrobium oceani]NJW53220.1 hypothetical protein [Salinimicrobium oceani]
MKVRYPKSRVKNNFIYGLLMIAVGLFAIYINRESLFSYLWVFIGMLQTGTAYYQKRKQYLTIEGNHLIKHSFIPKSIQISEITRIRKFVDSYRIETTGQSLLIEKSFIEEDSLQELNHFFESLSPRLATS